MPTSIKFLEEKLKEPNIQAALKTIRWTECNDAPQCYQYMFGSTVNNNIRFTDMSKHPNIHQIHNGINSTAAGAYQFLYGTYKDICEKYGFSGAFDAHTQDLMCLAIFDMIGVLNDVAKGYMLREPVMVRLSKQWASLPMSPWGQPVKTIAQVRDYYLASGGVIGN